MDEQVYNNLHLHVRKHDVTTRWAGFQRISLKKKNSVEESLDQNLLKYK